MLSPVALAVVAALASSAIVREVFASDNDTDNADDFASDNNTGNNTGNNTEDDFSDGVRGAPIVEFVGGAPTLKIYPAGSSVGDSTWIMLTFGKIQELTASGSQVTEHAIMSLAAEKDITWTQAEREVGGARATVTKMELPLEYSGSFRECSASGGGGGSGKAGTWNAVIGGAKLGGANNGSGAGASNPDARRLEAVGTIAVEVFLFTAAATIEYGGETIEVAEGAMKFNLEGQTWPFCGADHRLEVNLDIKTSSGNSGGSLGAGVGSGLPGSRFTASAGGRAVTMELPTVTLVDGELAACEVALDTTGGKTNLAFTFPAFSSTLVYDPILAFSSGDVIGDNSTTTGSGEMADDNSTTTGSGDMADENSTTTTSGDMADENSTTTTSGDMADENTTTSSADMDDENSTTTTSGDMADGHTTTTSSGGMADENSSDMANESTTTASADVAEENFTTTSSGADESTTTGAMGVVTGLATVAASPSSGLFIVGFVCALAF